VRQVKQTVPVPSKCHSFLLILFWLIFSIVMVLAWKAYVGREELQRGKYVDRGAWMLDSWSDRFERPKIENDTLDNSTDTGFKFSLI
jgi:hypothetical protein